MDRTTRKANLKKLQLPGTQQRITRRSTKTNGTASISNHFSSAAETPLPKTELQKDGLVSPSIRIASTEEKNVETRGRKTSPPKVKRAKRTKLDAFIYKSPPAIPTAATKTKPLCNNDDDFDVSEKKLKKAPPLPSKGSNEIKVKKTSRRKKQTTIKSAFLRNEQLFAEIAAQHCAADEFNGDDIQMAIAISKSEAESKGILDSGGDCGEVVVDVEDAQSDEQKAEQIRQKLERYGFRTAEKQDYNTLAAAFMPQAKTRRIKNKWANKFTALTLRDEQIQNKKLHEKIESLLNQQFLTMPLTNEERVFPQFYLQSSLLRKCEKDLKRNLFHLSVNPPTDNNLYFVTELFEISQLPPGNLLKDWANIPGRDLTPKKNGNNFDTESKLQRIYGELEDYFETPRGKGFLNDSELVKKENSVKEKEIEDNNSDKYRNCIQKENEKSSHAEILDKSPLKQDINCEIVLDSRSNTDSIKMSVIGKLLSPTKDLDLMHVSSTAISNQSVDDLKCHNSKINSTDTVKISCKFKIEEDLKIVYPSTINNSNANDENFSLSKVKTFEWNEFTTSDLEIVNVVNYNGNNENSHLLQEYQSSTANIALKSVKEKNESCLETVQVITPTTFITKTNGSNSPDIFADSDEEMEELKHNSKDSKNTTFVKGDKSSEDIENDGYITTYEIFSSDEDENRKGSLQQVGKSKSKIVEEIDLFADSPLQDEENAVIVDINSDSQQTIKLEGNYKETFKFTLSPLEVVLKSVSADELCFDENFNGPKEDDKDKEISSANNDDCVRHDIEMNDSCMSILDFQKSEPVKCCLNQETDVQIVSNGMEISPKKLKPGNDTLFHNLYNKYLGDCSDDKTNSQSKCNKNNLKTCSQFTMDLNISSGCNLNTRKSLSFASKTPEKCRDFSYCQFSKSHSFNEPNISIDLTQDEDEAEELTAEDECLMLSDDEINYSIWNANKTGRLNEIDNVSDSEQPESKNFKKKTSINKDAMPSTVVNVVSKEITLRTKLSISQDSYDEFDLKNHKQTGRSTSPRMKDFSLYLSPPRQNSQLERSNFGIIEEFSEPIEFATANDWDNISFLDSPTETSAPMKRFSSCRKSENQLSDLVSNLDQFGFQDDHSIGKEGGRNTSLPQGFDQLLTAQISFENTTGKISKNDKYFTKDYGNVNSTVSNPTSSTSCISKMEKQEITVNGKTYTIRSADLLKPDFTLYSEAELLKKLYEFGIKPLKRKQAIKMLEYIYIRTHPLIIDDMNSTDEPKQDKDDFLSCVNFDEAAAPIKALTSSFTLSPQDSICLTQNCRNTQINSDLAQVDSNAFKKLNLHDASGRDILRFSSYLKAEMPDEQYILQTNVTKKTPQPLMPLHIAWFNLVSSNPNLHENILMYEPIDLQEVYLFFKQLGYRYDPKDLKQFFDSRCVIFRYDLAAAGSKGKANGKNRHVRKKKSYSQK